MALGLSDNKKKLINGVVVPGAVLGAAASMGDFDTITGPVLAGVDEILQLGEGTVAPMLGTAVTAGLLSHNILGKFDWMNEHKKIKYALTAASALAGGAVDASFAPAILAAGAMYAGGRVLTPVTKWAVNRGAGLGYNLSIGAAKSLGVGLWEATKSYGRGIKNAATGNQWNQGGIKNLNPNTMAA